RMVATLSASSCEPHANAHPPPPMAHAPNPIGVTCGSALPSRGVCMAVPPGGRIVLRMQPIVLINAVGLTPRLLEHAPRLKAVADSGWVADMPEGLPAVTRTAQATILTGELPSKHGVVANGWLFRDTNEVRFWQQS